VWEGARRLGSTVMDTQQPQCLELPLFAVTETPLHGTALVAVKHLEEGQLLLSEFPIALVPLAVKGDAADSYSQYSSMPSRYWAQYFHFILQTDSVKAAMLALYSPVDGNTMVKIRQALQRFLDCFSARNVTVNGRLSRDIDVEEYVRVAAVYHFNAVAMAEGGSALLALGCRLTHACVANCAWKWDSEGRREVRVLRAVEAGERLTVDYLGGRVFGGDNAAGRRKELMDHYEFDCDCPLHINANYSQKDDS